jgi:mycofactocin precursor
MTETTAETVDAAAPTNADAQVGGTANAPDREACPAGPLVEAELLVEDVSIDGMCGVY